jgi:glycine/D-amino acid oxidase-like deaminating enzyme
MGDAPAPAKDYRQISLWHENCGDDWRPRDGLDGDTVVDVAIVGAGYTGLWTAYWLTELAHGTRVAIVEQEVAGFGASGRNGGFCSALFPTSLRRLAKGSTREAAIALQRTMNDAVGHIGEVVKREGIDCDFQRGGYLSVARNQAQLARVRSSVEEFRSWGFGTEHVQELSAAEVAERVRMSDALGGLFSPNCAAVHPAKLVRRLAECVERRGVTIYERTRATTIAPRLVATDRGTVHAEVVIRATEGYTPDLEGAHRDIVPMYSLMVATEPLDPALWESIGLVERTTFSDGRHLRIYGQRTADGRFAFGGRGAPYHFGSRILPEFDSDARVHEMLRHILTDLFPGIRDVAFTHAWGGNLGIPRDWYPSVTYDKATGVGSAGGYVGDGVATSEVAGRTLAHLISEKPSELTTLPWVGHDSPRWEPEPLRWVAVNAVTALFATADVTERRTGRPSRAAKAFWRVIGH